MFKYSVFFFLALLVSGCVSMDARLSAGNQILYSTLAKDREWMAREHLRQERRFTQALQEEMRARENTRVIYQERIPEEYARQRALIERLHGL